MKIFTDSGCDLPKSYYEENDVVLFPLRVQLNNQEYEDVLSIDSKEIYDAIRHGAHPKTSQVSPELFYSTLKALLKTMKKESISPFHQNSQAPIAPLK